MNFRKIKVIVAEDDYYSRSLLKGMLEKHTELEIIGEADNGSSLIQLSKKLRPQVIFVDIDMPETDGMSAAKEISAWNPNIFVVFVTGHVDFAVEAFDISNSDYILKPFEQERIDKSIGKILTRIRQQKPDFKKLASVLKSPEKLYIRNDHELCFIDTSNIFFIERDKNKRKSIVFTEKTNLETYESLSELESRLDKNIFFRSHKSYIINLQMIEKILPWEEAGYIVRFTNCNFEAHISKSRSQLLFDTLNI